MSVREKINAFYSDLLQTLMVAEDTETGALTYSVSSTSTPTTLLIGEKKLRLPRVEYMKESDPDYMYFHPMGEDISLGESPVFQQLNSLVVAKITIALMSLSAVMLKIGNAGASADNAMSLSAKQVEYIAAISGNDNLNDKIADKFNKVITAASKDAATRPVKITIRRNAKRYGEEKVYRRAAIVTFPLLTEIIKKASLGEDTLHGQKFSKYEMRLMINLYKAILPSSDIEDQYSIFSDSPHAPNLTALLLAYGGMSHHISKAARAFETYIDMADKYTESDWLLEVPKIPEYASVIPTSRGNEGVKVDDRGQLISRDYDDVVPEKVASPPRELERSSRREREDRQERDDLTTSASSVASALIESRDGRFVGVPLSTQSPQRHVQEVSDRNGDGYYRSEQNTAGDLSRAIQEAMRNGDRPRRDRDERDDYDDRSRRDYRDRDDRDRDYRDRDSRRSSSRYYEDDYDDRPTRRERAQDLHDALLERSLIRDDRSRRGRDDYDDRPTRRSHSSRQAIRSRSYR